MSVSEAGNSVSSDSVSIFVNIEGFVATHHVLVPKIVEGEDVMAGLDTVNKSLDNFKP